VVADAVRWAALPRGGRRVGRCVSDIREICVESGMAYMVPHLSITVGTGGEPVSINRAGTLAIFRKEGDRWLLCRDANLLVKS
jgi:hypothetical protein